MKLPFRVEYDPDRNEINLLVYYATSDTDWIRYDPEDYLIDYITWSQPQKNVYKLTVKLNQDHIWGYQCDYEGNVLNLDIKKSPADKLRLKDLKIVIDPGHSADPGAIGPTGMTEAEANLKISRELLKKLRDKGTEVVMTRYADEDVPIYDRPKLAVAEDCDIFISVHNNALPDGVNPFVNNGVSTFYYHLHSKKLAEMIQKEMSDELELDDYGHYYANFAVIRPTQYLAVLLECTFMILPEEEAKLKGDKFPEKCADAIVEGIEEFLDYLED
jgi:N-acetylmuramoyl-L-alanine amidase